MRSIISILMINLSYYKRAKYERVHMLKSLNNLYGVLVTINVMNFGVVRC